MSPNLELSKRNGTGNSFAGWIAGLAGVWRLGDTICRVFVPKAGAVCAYRPCNCAPVDVESVIRTGVRIRDCPALLGPNPVVLNAEMMRVWLSAEEQKRFRWAHAVQTGRIRLAEAIEHNIREWERFCSESELPGSESEQDTNRLITIWDEIGTAAAAGDPEGIERRFHTLASTTRIRILLGYPPSAQFSPLERQRILGTLTEEEHATLWMLM